jgi:type I restriction enzyme M protein
VANPPFSDKRWSNGLHPNEGGAAESEGTEQTAVDYERFKDFGIPPAKQGDYAYLLHIVKSLKSTGKGACILPHGVLFRGNSEGTIRKALVRKGFIQAVIGLPANLFYGTGIPACIVVIDKKDAQARKGIFMMDASAGFLKDGPKNRLREQDIHKIVDAYARQSDLPRFSRLVPFDEIERNEYNLNLPRYIDSTVPEDIQDIEGHLRGGIPRRDIDALGPYWKVFPGVRSALLKRADRPDYAELKVAPAEVKSVILGHAEFQAFKNTITGSFQVWRNKYEARLKALGVGVKPKALIQESLLETFRPAPLLDAYDLYQHLMDLWAETMRDDVYLIVADGWLEAAKPRLILDEKDSKKKQVPDFTVGKLKYKTELVPVPLLVAKFFASEAAAIEGLEAEVAGLEQRLEELTEEHTGEDGALSEVVEDGKIPKGAVAALLKKTKPGLDTAAERKIWLAYQDLVDQLAVCNKELKSARADLEAKVADRFKTLKEAEVKALVVEDKWLAALEASLQSELDRVSQTLSARLRELAERYGTPLPRIRDEVAELERKVAGHLAQMGFAL